MNNIQLIRLYNGIDIISEYIEVDEETISLINPIAIGFVMRGGKTVMFMESWTPVTIMVENSVPLRRKDIVFTSELRPSIIVNYMDMAKRIMDSKENLFKVGMEDNKEEDMDMVNGDIHILEELDMEGETLQ